jgi:hypothetical protein
MKTGYQIAVHNPAYLSRPGTWVYSIIRKATQSHWNHWAGVWVREDGEVFVVEMRGGGKRSARRITRFAIWLSRNPDRVFEVLAAPQVSRQELDQHSGAYDYFSLVIRHPVFRLTGKWVGREQDRARTCSEYWGRVHKVPFAYRVSPGDLAILFGATKK